MQRFLSPMSRWKSLGLCCVWILPFLLTTVVLAQQLESMRTWTDASGTKSTAKAELVGLADGIVELRRQDGKTIRMALAKLSPADQRYVQQSLAKAAAPPVPFEATERPKTTPSKPSSPSGGTHLMKVIAEGVGHNPDEAIKDAFRNAVRQVVGAVVDAETLVKNDALIEDKVLTYSDGYIKKYEEVAGSKKQQGGLHWIKITAQVERRSVVAKLKATNITAKKVDGKSMFAEVVTQLEAEKDATKLLSKALADLPTLLTASVVGKPEYDRDKSEVVLTVVIEVDKKAYKATLERLEPILAKIALTKDSLLVKGQVDPRNEKHPSVFMARHKFFLGPPKISPDRKNVWCLWVCSSATGNNQNLRFNRYALDADALCFDTLCLASKSFADRKTLLQVRLTTKNGKVVSEDELELLADANLTKLGSLQGHPLISDSSKMPFIAHVIRRERANRRGNERVVVRGGGNERVIVREGANQEGYTVSAFVAPYSFTVQEGDGEIMFYSERRRIQFRIPIPLDDLKEVQDITCRVVYTPPATR